MENKKENKFFEKEIDPSISRKRKILDISATQKENFVLPGIVEVSESGICNRKCSFCPRSDKNYPDIKEFVKDELIEKLTSQLGDLNYKGIFLFSGFVEPLLDKNIFNLLKKVRKNIPLSRIEMVTNGDVLNSKRLNLLYESGLDYLQVSVYDGPEDEENFKKLFKKNNIDDTKYKIRPRYLPPEENFGLNLSNRGGTMENAEFSIPSLKEAHERPCYYPHYLFFMDYQGDVILCPHDWGKKFMVGNMNKSNFLDLWNGQKMKVARQNLTNANRKFSPCSKCDVNGVFMGKNFSDKWKNIYES